ncbi:response regulator [bacterium]|nr:response regulator [bacterium]
MTWQAHPFSAVLLASAALAVGVARALWRRSAAGSRTCALLMLTLAWWSAVYGIELLTTTRAAQLALVKVEYLGILAAPLAWLVFALRFTGRDMGRAALAALCAVPAVLYALVLTDGPRHQMLYARAETVEVGGYAVLRVVYGPAAWTNVAYAYLCLAAGALVIVHAFRASPRIYRRQVAALLAGAAAPWAVNVVYMLGFSPGVDLTPLGFTVTGLGAAWALRHAQLLDLVPVARDRVMESLRDGVAVLDRQQRLVDCNPAFAAALGRSVGDCIGIAATRLVGACPELLGLLRGEAASAPLSLAGGRLYEPMLQELTDRRGRPVGRLLTLRDITDRGRVMAELTRARDAAEALARAKSEFLATVSHEIRTPMNGVVGMTALLLDTPLSAEQRECVDVIRQSGDQLLAIINEILDFSKLDAGGLTVEHIPFAPRRAVADVVELLRPQAAGKGLRLEYHSAAAVPALCLGDPTRVRQIATNLVGNAIKFTAAGTVVVTLDATPATDGAQRLRLVVRDTGIGIPAHRLPDLFQPFSQVDASTARRYGGTGLGLAISRRLAELMGGTIAVASEEGHGATFTADWLVGAAAAQSEPPADVAGVRPAAPAGLRILVAEDNPVNQKVVLRMLQRLGYQADVAGDGERAVAAATAQPYDVVLMDVQMPGVDGYEATRRIRSERRGRQPRIIAMTANAMASDRDRCLAAGMDDYISKPLRPDDLRAAFERMREAARSAAASESDTRQPALS